MKSSSECKSDAGVLEKSGMIPVLNKNGFLFDINRLTELLCFLLGEQNYVWSKQNEKRDKQRLSHRITL